MSQINKDKFYILLRDYGLKDGSLFMYNIFNQEGKLNEPTIVTKNNHYATSSFLKYFNLYDEYFERFKDYEGEELFYKIIDYSFNNETLWIVLYE